MNCKGNLHLFRKALPTFNANPEGGVFLLTSSIAGIGPQGSAMAYSVSKAAGGPTTVHNRPHMLTRVRPSIDEMSRCDSGSKSTDKRHLPRSLVDRLGKWSRSGVL